ncbi:ATP-binding protein [uncultured Methanobrevibacter sp.]|uniref:ATP-binding protein n=1 Tax=uncultured Methanobrevibacter sp. TaxID=253161 RepID=UPI00260B4E38|nr:ATP-binding protein [uncultured Methanobrevibacter sp.]
MGKTSLAKYVQKLVSDKMLGVYISNKGNESLEKLATDIIEGLVNYIPENSIKHKIKKIFGDSIESLEFKGTKVNFKLNDYATKDFVNDFSHYLYETYLELNTDKGIFLIIDDINGLSDSKEFVNWYKRFADTIEMRNYNIPIYILIAGYPEKFQNLVNHDESFARIFHYDDIDYLSENEITDFFKDTFNSVNMNCDEDALSFMTTFSRGIPLMMQEIGDTVFWETEGFNVNINYAKDGIIEAGRLIGRQIKPVLDRTIRSEKYENILMKLGKYSADSFKKSNFEKYLTSDEKKVFSDFLKRATQLNILESIGKYKSGEYRFSNRLYLVYFMILNFENDISN